ncbi:hypothetical protein [Xanthomonas oryzae]|uniref:hypothetical protein n=1 Tax=Xanthomonas oryzae TaxID=347 RepID=UPI000464289A|nr:hypothetical protein [Xanthomonas oryzae]ALS96289.1 hypothetical protein AXO1947_19200 [Xanthomonas oryzae pv. oryzae]AUI89176.1 hypothetical protein BVV16_01180 [Xanthomonas oryzae pv. oryzae]AUI92848.1 hypothetical protein BVV17_01180 [Xanthomonas oryzae pv. oryzae]AUI96521.1 hypothetical protein BVV18_01185 [Xanthomonas oryzae pv. oryzae]AUJ00192.1 hypothetical protein BVV10_01180 [Xanthomonas oryzae pv. oryzae]
MNASQAKDGAALLVTAIMASFFGWAFWRYAGDDGFAILTLLSITVLGVDNWRLRRELRRRK